VISIIPLEENCVTREWAMLSLELVKGKNENQVTSKVFMQMC